MHRRRFALIGVLAMGALASGCAHDTASTHAGPHSARDFVTLMSSGLAVDYEPLESPDEAVAHSPFIVEGTLEKVLPRPAGDSSGSRLTGKPTSHAYVLLVIHVEHVIKGSAAVANDRLYARYMNGNATAEELTKLIPDGRVVAVVSEPDPVAPAPAPAPLPNYLIAPVQVYDLYVDGLWFQGSADSTMVGAYVRPDELPAAWRQPTTLDDYIQRLSEAAGS